MVIRWKKTVIKQTLNSTFTGALWDFWGLGYMYENPAYYAFFAFFILFLVPIFKKTTDNNKRTS